jgi:hypothetical protein
MRVFVVTSPSSKRTWRPSRSSLAWPQRTALPTTTSAPSSTGSPDGGGIPKAFNPDQDDRAWKARAQSLPDVLGEDYESAKASVVNAHFTEVFVIEAMWRAVRRLGFRGGRVLEPSAGVGYFIGAMPRDLAATSEVTAVEIDRVSSRILSSLYAPHGVRTFAVGFEKARLPTDWYDLVISNVPFGNYPVPEDRNVPYANFLIHDYFFARALEVTRPGGLVAFITSAGTLDKGDDRARRHIGEQARFLGAIRLPSGTFSQIANTDVTTDIVFLQKLAEGEQAAGDWIGVSEAPPSMCDTDRRLFISSWYVDHPDLLIGRMGLKSNGFGPANAAIFDGDVSSALTERVARLPEDVYLPRAVENLLSMPREHLVAAPEFVKPGAYCLTPDGRLAISEGDALRVIDATVSTARRIRGLMAIRDAARRLLHLQPVTADDGRLGEHRAALNTAYDTFVAQHGILHAMVNKRAFKGDPDLPLLLSLEDFDRGKRHGREGGPLLPQNGGRGPQGGALFVSRRSAAGLPARSRTRRSDADGVLAGAGGRAVSPGPGGSWPDLSRSAIRRLGNRRCLSLRQRA